MKRFCLFSILYFCIGLVLLIVCRDNPADQLYSMIGRTVLLFIKLLQYSPYLLAGFIVVMLTGRYVLGKALLAEMGWAFLGCVFLSAGFAFIKTCIPFIIPFYADPFFADLDKALHGGIDPWVLTHSLQAYIDPTAVSVLYFGIWGLPAIFFPLLLAILDQDQERKQRFILLYLFVWIGLGNVIAYAGSSVGPVYYDRLLGTDRFGDLLLALGTSGITDSRVGEVQTILWDIYTTFDELLGSGISAFPSVHNGIATLVMVYLFERSKWLAPVGVLFCAAILFASVYVGWHYAIDGYVSIILVVGAWAALRKYAQRQPKDAATPFETPIVQPAE